MKKPLRKALVVTMFIGLASMANAQQVWTMSNPLPAHDEYWTAVAYGNGRFVCVGFPGTILSSEDGTTWTKRYSGDSLGLSGVVWGANQFIAVGSRKILSSQDGITWIKQTLDSSWGLCGIAWGSGKFVSVGYVYVRTTGGSSVHPIILSSTDGMTWASQQFDSAGDMIESVAWGDSEFLAVDLQNRVMTSPDGTHWSFHSSKLPLPAGTVPFSVPSVSWCNDRFISVGSCYIPCGIGGHCYDTTPNNALIFSSSDGNSWTMWENPQPTKLPLHLDGVAYGDGSYVAVGYVLDMYPCVYSSTDAVNWSPQDSGVTLTAVAWGNHTFVAVGDADTILVSHSSPAAVKTSLPSYSINETSVTRTSIRYQLESQSPVKIGIYSLQGRHIRTLLDDVQGCGSHYVAIPFDLTSGNYVVSVDIGQSQVRKMVSFVR